MSGWENPAAALREELRARFPGAMVRWDASGRALLMTDAPRRGYAVADAPVENGLAYYDLPLNQTITPPAPVFGAYADGVFALQSALATTLPGGGAAHGCPGDFSTQGRSLLRGALTAHACGEKQVLTLLPRLRGLWAQSLRTGSAADQSACRLAACILAAWLMEEKKAGVPFST